MSTCYDNAIETLMMDVCSGSVDVAALTPEEAYALSGFVSERSNRLHEAGYALPSLPESSDDMERRLFLINFADCADDYRNNSRVDHCAIDGEWRDSSDQRVSHHRFRQAHVDFATERTHERVTGRLRKALAPFKLSKDKLESSVAELAKMPGFYLVDDGSSLFDFDQKVTQTVALLNEKGAALSKEDYVKACVREPQLFSASPQTVTLNLIGRGEVQGHKRTGIVTLLHDKYHLNLPLQDYVKACVSSPRLFYANPKTILNNLVGKGTVRGQPRTGFVTLLKEEHNINLPLKDYVHACLGSPSLFSADPHTIMLNLAGKGEVHGKERTGFVTLLQERHDIKVPLRRYLNVCLSLPRLFNRDPESVCNNVSIVLDIAKHLNETKHAFPIQPLTPKRQRHGDAVIMERLFNVPFVLALNPENLELRRWYAEYKYKEGKPVHFSIFTNTREKAENTVIKALGGEPGQPVEKKFTEADMDNWNELSQADKQEKANSMLLRTLIHAGIISSVALKDSPAKDSPGR